MEYLEEHLDGNLCRCTGYRPIWDAARILCDDVEGVYQQRRGPCGILCDECPEQETCQHEDAVSTSPHPQQTTTTVCCSTSGDKIAAKEALIKSQPHWKEQATQMFPKELLDHASVECLALTKPLMVVDHTEFHGAGTWFKPTNLVELLSLVKDFGNECKIVVGNTEVGIGRYYFHVENGKELDFGSQKVLCLSIETRFKQAVYPRLVFPSDAVECLYDFAVTPDQVVIGACVPLSRIQHQCQTLATTSRGDLARTLMPIHDMLRWFASTQIRNVACLGGNLVTASPISDMNPMLASMGAKLVLSKLDDSSSTISRRFRPVSEFFLRYRTVDRDPSEIVERIEIPILGKVFEYVKPFKQARRREDDISIVTSGMHIKLGIKEGKFVIEHIALAFGGMAPKTIMAVETARDGRGRVV